MSYYGTNEGNWIDEFYQDPSIQDIRNYVSDNGLFDKSRGHEDLVTTSFQICHGIKGFVTDFPDAPITKALNEFLNKFEYMDSSSKDWQRNPCGQRVYNFLINKNIF